MSENEYVSIGKKVSQMLLIEECVYYSVFITVFTDYSTYVELRS